MVQRIRLFSVAVADLEEAIQRYEKLFGLQVMTPTHDTQFGFQAAILGNGSDPLIELIHPVDPDSALARFMRERAYPSNPHGEGVYMVNLEVDDVAKAVQQVRDQGGRVNQPGETSSAAWVHPTSANFAFVELTQAQG